jgi:hypothetical protein
MSPVTTTVRGPARSAIQSSAASKPASTVTRSISGCAGTRSQALLTIRTAASWRKATL